MRKSLMIAVALMMFAVSAHAQESKNELPFITIQQLMNLAKPNNMQAVQDCATQAGYRYRGGKSQITRLFIKGVTVNNMNKVTQVNDAPKASTINYSSDGTISVDVFLPEYRDTLRKEIENLGFATKSDGGTLIMFNKAGTLAYFTLMTYKVGDVEAYSVSYSAE